MEGQHVSRKGNIFIVNYYKDQNIIPVQTWKPNN